MRFACIIFFSVLTARLAAQSTEPNDFLSQEYFISKVLKSSDQYGRTHPTEKIYIHFDKPFYLVSDTAWFNIYVVDSQLEPATNSLNVFVDWIYEDGTVMKHQQYRIQNGRASGNFPFLDHSDGRYHIRAYTNLMETLSADYLYYTRLVLINPSKTSHSSGTSGSKMDSMDVQFFPEGGYLVNGLESQVAFKAINKSGNGIDFEGLLIDDRNQPITPVKSGHKGMGIFALKPVEGRSYKLIWNNRVFELPKPLKSGVVMGVSSINREFFDVRIQASDDLIPGRFYLIGQARGNVCFRDMFTLDDTSVILQVPKNSIPQGILQLTLFDENSIPKSERVIFANQETDLKLTISFNKEVYGPREKISLGIHVADKNGRPVQAQMSVSVTDAAFAKRNLMSTNIRTQLLLQSDLKGKIEDPGWYFEAVNPEKVFALDLVMLTHGWRKFIWEQVLTDDTGEDNWYEPEKGLSIFGRVVTTKNSKPLPAADITLLTNFSKGGVYTATGNAEGNFMIDDLNFNDSTRFVWQIRDQKGKQADARVIFLAPKVPPVNFSRMINTPYSPDEISLNALMSSLVSTGAWDSNNANILEVVEIKGNRESSENNTNSIIPEDYHRLSVKPTVVEATSYTEVTKLISDKFPNVTFFGWGVNMDVRIRGVNKLLEPEREVPPLILLDGQIVSTDDINDGGVYHALNLIPVSEVERIEVLSGAAASIYGARGGSGVIAIYSKEPFGKVVVDGKAGGKGVLKVVPSGYDWPKEFYHPRYVDNEQPSSFPDYRMTLFWDPLVQTNGSGNAEIQFYNSDIARTLQVVVEGMANGVPIFGVK